MLNNILNLEGVAVLNKKQQRSINGGDCAYFNGETGQIYHHMSSSDAQGMLQNASDHWCCSSCGTASWYQACSNYRHTVLSSGAVTIMHRCEEIE